MDFDGFFAEQGAGLARYAGVLTGDRQLAHDVLADALLEVGAKWTRVGAMENPAGYVRRVIVTTFLNHQRKVGRRKTFPAGLSVAKETPGPDRADRLDDLDDLHGRLTGLPIQQRAALVLRYYLDLPDAEIAEMLGCAQGTVRSNISRALAALKADAVNTAKE